MENTWSHLLLVFGLAAPLVSASPMQTAVVNSNTTIPLSTTVSPIPSAIQSSRDVVNTRWDVPTSTTLVTMTSADPTSNKSLDDGELVQTTATNFPTSATSVTIMSASPTSNRSLADDGLIHDGDVVHFLHTSSTSVTIASANSTAYRSLGHGDVLQAAAKDFPTSATFVTMTSANPAITQSLDDVVSIFNPVPTTSPSLSVIQNYTAPTATPGSVAIINGIPTRVLSDTIAQINEARPGRDDDRNNAPMSLYQPWNTSYPGVIHDGDWNKYLKNWDPVWWSLNLDSLKQTACMCSAADFYTNPKAQLASYMHFEYYSHNLGAVYGLDWHCGPSPSSMSIKHRHTSAKGKSEHCWQAAGGEFAGDHWKGERLKGYYCDEKKELCVAPWRAHGRAMKFHDHKRNYDRDGVHTWSEIQPVVADVCKPICEEKFGMQYNDFSHHNPNFITTFYPPKPIDLTIVGD